MPVDRITPANVVEHLSAQTGIPPEQVKALLEAQARSAYVHAEHGYPIPGIGTLTLLNTPERKTVLRIGPQAGQQITIPAKQKLNFRVYRLAREMLFNPAQSLPDLFAPSPAEAFRFSTEAKELVDASPFLQDLRQPLTFSADGRAASVAVYQLPDLLLPSGRIRASDFLVGGGEPFTRDVPPGRHPLALVAAKIDEGHERIALAVIRFSARSVASWEMAVTPGRDLATLKPGQVFGYGVDSGTGSFCDASAAPLLEQANEEDVGFPHRVMAEMRRSHQPTRDWIHIETPNGSAAGFSSGYGDGSYASYFGLDDTGNPVVLLTDFNIVDWQAAEPG